MQGKIQALQYLMSTIQQEQYVLTTIQGNETLFGENAGKQCVAMSLTATICDLSRENVPYGIRSNGRTHGM